MKNRLLKCTGLIIGLVFVFALFPQSTATVIWDDDFNGGTIAPEWIVKDGDWTAIDNYLRADNIVAEEECVIWRNCTQTVGTWSIDVYHGTDDEYFKTTVLFFANGTEVDDFFGYGIRLLGDIVYLVKQLGGFTTISLLGSATTEGLEDSWTSFDVTRNSTGGIHVYINATSYSEEPDIIAVDHDFDTSERFVIQARVDVSGEYFDNIIIDDELPDSTTSTPTSPTTNGELDSTLLLMLGAGVGGAVIIAAVVCLRRR